MAGEKIVGKISEISGDGNVLIVRASGERIVAKVGDGIFEGDTVVTSQSAAVKITTDANFSGTQGFVSIGSGQQARFDAALSDQTSSLIGSSSPENPVSVGSLLTPATVSVFNETFPGQVFSSQDTQSPLTSNSPFNEPSGNPFFENIPQNPSVGEIDNNPLGTLPGVNNPGSNNPEELPVVGENTFINGNEEDGEEENTDELIDDVIQERFGGGNTENQVDTFIPDSGGEPTDLPPPTTTEEVPSVEFISDPTIIDPNIVIPNDNSVGLNNDDLLVAENATTAASGTFTISATSGIDSLQIGGTTLTLAQLNASGVTPVNIPGAMNGTLQITGFDAASGVVSYTYLPTGTSQDHSAATNDIIDAENLALVLTDAAATPETVTGTLNIGITDTSPTANNDARSISEGTSAIAGNVFGVAGAATGDVQDDPLIDANATPVSALNSTGTYGSIVISNAGIYTYTLDNTSSDVQALKNGQSVADVFTYTITDGDGDTDTASLTVTINGVEDAPPVITAPANSVSDGSGTTINGMFTATASAGLTSVTIAGSDISGATTGTASTHVTLTGVDGNLVVTNFNTATGVVSYNYTENGTLNTATADNFSIVATDNEGDTDTDTLAISIDDLPLVTVPSSLGVGAVGDESISENAVLGATFTVFSSVGLQTTGTALSLTVDGATTTLTLSQLNALGAAPVTITDGNDGNLTLQSFNAASGVIAYTFDPTGTSRDHSGGDESVVEQYSIVATDANGNSNTSEVLDILITDTNPTANDDERSISEGTSAIAGNVFGIAGAASGDVQDTINDSNANPVTDVDFGSTDGTPSSGLAGNYGSVVISSAGIYTYTLDNTSSDVQGLKGGESLTDVFTYTIQDGDGDTDTASLTVTINGVEDAVPTVTAPANNVLEGTGSTINGMFTASADAGLTSVTLAGSGAAQNISGATTATASSHVTLTGVDGNLVVTNFNTATGVVTYNYTENGTVNDHSSGAVIDNFTIVATDNEGDTDSETLAITIDDAPLIIIPNDNSIGANNDDLLVAENATTTGSFTVSAPQGVSSVQIGGTTITLAQLNAATSGSPVDITGETFGALQVTDYNSSTGVVTYTYDPTGSSSDHSGAMNDILGENLAIVLTETSSLTTVTATLDIGITDTSPTANDDARSISEGTSAIAGNVFGIAGSASGDVQDSVLVDSNATPVGAGTFAGNYGTLGLSNSGVYTYTLDNTSSNVQGLKNGESLTDVFTYTITDGDGDTDTASLTVTVDGVDDPLPTVTIVDNNGAATGEHSVTEANVTPITGQVTITASAGVSTLTVAGQDVTNATTSNVSVTGSQGTLVVTGFTALTGVITYSYTEDGNNEDHSGGEILDNFTILVTDNEGDTDSDSLDIQIIDTAPTAATDTGSVTEDASLNTVTGDVITNDTQGADTAISVTGIDFGGAKTVGTLFSSANGTLDLNADGTYTYTLDNGDSAVNALNNGQSLVETFSYTIVDTDGDTSSSTLAITVNGADETVISSTTTSDNETLTGTNVSENFFTDTVLGVSDGATGAEIVDGNGGSDRLIINGDDIPMVAIDGDNQGGGSQRIELQDFTFANTASNSEGDVIDISDLLDAAGADSISGGGNNDGTISAAEATPYIHISETQGGTNGGVISIDVGGGFDNTDRAAINAGNTITDVGTGDRDLVISSTEASADLDTAAAAGGYTGPAYSAVEADQTAQIQALVDQNILVIDS